MAKKLELWEDNGGGLHWAEGNTVCHMMGGWDPGQGMRDIVDLAGNRDGDWPFEPLQEGYLEGEIEWVLTVIVGPDTLTIVWPKDPVSSDGVRGGNAAKDYLLG